MLLFHEETMRYLSDAELKLEGILNGMEANKSSASIMVGLDLDAFLNFGPRFPDQRKLLDLIDGWTEQAQGSISPLKAVLHIALSRKAVPEHFIHRLDNLPVIRASLGCGLARRRKFDLATSLLKDALLKSRGAFRLIEFGYLSAELVKCFNALQEDEKGESTGKRALTLLTMKGNDLKMRTDLAYLTVAIGDSLIGQGKYGEAKAMFTTVLKTEDLPPRLAAVTALRMNKVNRRILLKDGCTLALASPLGTALSCVEEAEREVKLECITEIGATIAQLELNSQEDVFADHDVQNFLRATVETFSKDENLVQDWRLENVNVHLSEKKRTFSPERTPSPHITFDQEYRTEGISTNSSHEARSHIVHESWEQKSAFTLERGGVRSYASLLMLRALMTAIRRIELEYNDAHMTSFHPFGRPGSANKMSLDESSLVVFLPCHYFDYIVGAGTGGIAAIMLSRLRMSVQECLENFKRISSELFERRINVFGFPRPKYNKSILPSAIDTIISERTPSHSQSVQAVKFKRFLSPPDLCRTIVLAVRKERITSQPDETTPNQREFECLYLFRSYKIEEFDPDNPLRNYGWDINHTIRGVWFTTIVDPTFFEAAISEGDFSFDGGAGVNPTFEALEEIFRLHKNSPIMSASFGAGKPPLPVFLFGKGRGLPSLIMQREVFRLLKPDSIAALDCEEIHLLVQERARRLADGPKSFQYFRFNVEGDLGNVPFDECKTNRDDGMGGKCSTFEYITRCTDIELGKLQVQEQLRELATQLVKQRRQRIRDDPDRWERFACCTVYICSDDECRIDGKGIFNLRREMRAHLQVIHELPEGEQGQELETRLDECRKLPEYPGGPF
ncbi:uncharacterized protein K444DRAFT_662717 [Hyaloscypha bicolor E]|uniref:PNPLA domain-containing protein n=1 Tax=Hyaloscypha bicolor E TaxID=1095630 RepID=A0A2J6TFC1_9HELO|nr:uncharacterized protein K444DRAFT_662717 [Hyaloscypha bicolor E]PMD61716.1 hypothetical protein K444DRAFT_662717 [Hyaloscypha bicolor E]